MTVHYVYRNALKLDHCIARSLYGVIVCVRKARAAGYVYYIAVFFGEIVEKFLIPSGGGGVYCVSFRKRPVHKLFGVFVRQNAVRAGKIARFNVKTYGADARRK